MRFFLVFIIIPIIELSIILKIGQSIGIFYTISIIIVTGIFGVFLAKQQGFIVLQKLQKSLEYGQMPGDVVFDGFFIFAGGLVLLTPGFITDIIGFMFLIPLTRNIFKNYIKKIFEHYFNTGQIRIFIK